MKILILPITKNYNKVTKDLGHKYCYKDSPKSKHFKLRLKKNLLFVSINSSYKTKIFFFQILIIGSISNSQCKMKIII